MRVILKRVLVLAIVAAVGAGCGDEGEQTDSAQDVTLSGADGEGNGDHNQELPVQRAAAGGALDSTVCATVQERIMSCGLLHTLSSFEADCAGWASVGDGAKLSALEECAVKPCQAMLACVQDLP